MEVIVFIHFSTIFVTCPENKITKDDFCSSMLCNAQKCNIYNYFT